MKKIVLIGATGFVGSAILKEALNRGHQVIAIARNPEIITIKSENLTIKQIDVTNETAVAEVSKGADAVISAYNPGWSNPNIYEETLHTYPIILNGVKRAGVKRILIVGGAATLFVSPGLRLIDAGLLPEAYVPGAKSIGEFYLNTLMVEKEIDWIFLSPAAHLLPGERTANFRLGKDNLIVDTEGNSNISVEDYAVAMIDELENPTHHQERFTLAY